MLTIIFYALLVALIFGLARYIRNWRADLERMRKEDQDLLARWNKSDQRHYGDNRLICGDPLPRPRVTMPPRNR